MIQPNLPRNSIIKANYLVERFKRCSLKTISLDTKKDAIRNFYPRYSRGPNGTLVDKLPKKQVKAIFLDLYEDSKKLIEEDPRQATYRTFKKLEKAAKEKDLDKFEALEEKLAIQLESQDTYDYEIEKEFFVYNESKEDIFSNS